MTEYCHIQIGICIWKCVIGRRYQFEKFEYFCEWKSSISHWLFFAYANEWLINIWIWKICIFKCTKILRQAFAVNCMCKWVIASQRLLYHILANCYVRIWSPKCIAYSTTIAWTEYVWKHSKCNFVKGNAFDSLNCHQSLLVRVQHIVVIDSGTEFVTRYYLNQRPLRSLTHTFTRPQ